MDRALYQLTVLMASGCVGVLLVATYFKMGNRATIGHPMEVTQNWFK